MHVSSLSYSPLREQRTNTWWEKQKNGAVVGARPAGLLAMAGAHHRQQELNGGHRTPKARLTPPAQPPWWTNLPTPTLTLCCGRRRDRQEVHGGCLQTCRWPPMAAWVGDAGMTALGGGVGGGSRAAALGGGGAYSSAPMTVMGNWGW